jgi:hypothetical protein
MIFIVEEGVLFDPIHISLFGFVGIIFQADFFADSIKQFLRLLIHIIDIIYFCEVLVDKLPHFIHRFCADNAPVKTLSKRDVDFDSDKLTLADFAH